MTEAHQQQTGNGWQWLRIIGNLLACTAIIGGAVGAIVWINRTEPVAEKINATRKSSALVETITAKRGTYSPRLVVLGTVEAAQQISLRPRVNGQVIELSPEFVPGGMVEKGDSLLRIDPADFENALSISKSELAKAEASMEIENARQQLAETELKLLEDSIGEANRGLVMREPQLASIKAEVSAANAAIERAQLNLERTRIHSPFDAQVLTRAINIGSQVGPGDELAQLIGLDEYWIIATVPIRSLRWVQFPAEQPDSPDLKNLSNSEQPETVEATSRDDDATLGSRVTLRDPDGWGADASRNARVSKLIGTLDQQTRLARVLITVKDPLGLKSDVPPLILNTLIETEIEGKPIEGVIRLDRGYVRNQDTVWVMKNEKLEIRETEIVFRDAQYTYIREGLDDGDEVVTSTLATVAPGIGLRKINESGASSDADRSTTPDKEVGE